MNIQPRLLVIVGIMAFSLGLAMTAQAYGDPPGRVARLSDSRGEVSYSPSGENDWLYVVRNRPLISGDRLWSSRRARAELQVGSAAVRMGENTSLELLDISDEIVQMRMTQGTINVRVRRLYRGQSVEIATPTLAFVIDSPGNYRIDRCRFAPRLDHRRGLEWRCRSLWSEFEFSAGLRRCGTLLLS